MKIGFMGAGQVAQTIAKHLLPFGHQVMLSNSRGPDSLAGVVQELGAGATAGTLQQVGVQPGDHVNVTWDAAAAHAVAD